MRIVCSGTQSVGVPRLPPMTALDFLLCGLMLALCVFVGLKVVSSDFISNPYSSVFDAKAVRT
jgi:hypothetical protein